MSVPHASESQLDVLSAYILSELNDGRQTVHPSTFLGDFARPENRHTLP